MKDLENLNRDMKAAGVWVFAAGLHPTGPAAVVRQQGSEALVTDGPFVEGKEHFGGFTVIDAPDRDAPLGRAGKLAGATTLPVEVLPLQA